MGGGMTIGALGRATGTNPETIRFHERIGVLPEPARTAGSYRSYGETHAARLTFVRKARDLGVPLETVRSMLALADQRKSPGAKPRR